MDPIPETENSEWKIVAPETSANTNAEVQEIIQNRLKLAAHLTGESAAKNLAIRIELSKLNPPPTDEQISQCIDGLPNLNPAGPKIKLWQTHPQLMGSEKTRYNRDIVSASLGEARFIADDEVHTIIPALESRVAEHRIVLSPGGILTYQMEATFRGKDGPVTVAGDIFHTFAVTAGMTERHKQPTLMTYCTGFTERVWDKDSQSKLGNIANQTDQSSRVATFLHRRYLSHPFVGGLPGTTGQNN